MTEQSPIMIIGLPRSGTTLVSRLLGLMPGVHVEMEPHLIWKAGNFHYLEDDRFDIRHDVTRWIRDKFLHSSGVQQLVEKSPVNCIRPQLVREVFPDARILYIERDPVRCIYSNYQKSVRRESLKASIVIRKYLLSKPPSSSHDGGLNLLGQTLTATGGRPFSDQLRIQDGPGFSWYLLRMLYLRYVKKTVPFGPKLRGFGNQVEQDGLLAYHLRVYRKAQACRKTFQEDYGDAMGSFRMEAILDNPEEMKRLYQWAGFEAGDQFIQDIYQKLNPELIRGSRQPGPLDGQIRRLLAQGNGAAS